MSFKSIKAVPLLLAHLLFIALLKDSFVVYNPTKRDCMARNCSPVSIHGNELRNAGLSRCNQGHANSLIAPS